MTFSFHSPPCLGVYIERSLSVRTRPGAQKSRPRVAHRAGLSGNYGATLVHCQTKSKLFLKSFLNSVQARRGELRIVSSTSDGRHIRRVIRRRGVGVNLRKVLGHGGL